MGGQNEREYTHVDDYVKKLVSQEQAYSLVRYQLGKYAERNKEIYDMRMIPEQCFVGTWVLYYSPHRYVGRSPWWQLNYSGPFLITKRHSDVTVSVQRSQKSDALVVHTDKLKSFLGEPRSGLNDRQAFRQHRD